MNLFKQFGTDAEMEKSGIWLQYGKTEDGRPIRIKIARAGGSNQKYLKVLDIKTKPIRRQIQNDMIDLSTSDAIMMEVFAETVVLGWENVEDKDGAPIPFTKENVVALFKELPDLFADVRDQATKSALFRTEVLENEGKNS